jgi:hypothetical protein
MFRTLNSFEDFYLKNVWNLIVGNIRWIRVFQNYIDDSILYFFILNLVLNIVKSDILADDLNFKRRVTNPLDDFVHAF